MIVKYFSKDLDISLDMKKKYKNINKYHADIFNI